MRVLSIVLTLASGASSVAQNAPPLRLYFDADRTRSKAAGDAIERGIRVALSEVSYRLGRREVELIAVDHRGSTPRSRKNVLKAAADPRGLLVFAGMHSPPLLKCRKLIHEKKLPVLVPWAAAGPITRHPSGENYVFRLSVDDTKAGRVIATHAIKNRGAKVPVLLLEETGWGRSNERTMTAAVRALGMPDPGVRWFRWGMDGSTADKILDSIRRDGADAVLLVANAPEARAFLESNAKRPVSDRIKFFSHWGLTGANFADQVSHETRAACGLEFIQTRFSFLTAGRGSLGARVFARARALYPEWRRPADLRPATGFVHGYDLTRLLIAACRGSALEGPIDALRAEVRGRLERIDIPVRGLLKTYRRPFSQFSETNPDAHEALDVSDLTMGRYRSDGAIELIEPSTPARPGK